MNGSTHPVPPDGPISPDLLADLQAGLLDDATAAWLRRRVRADPEAAATLAALDRVRRDLAALGTDPASAPVVPGDLTARLTATLRTAAPPTHSTRAPGHRLRMFGAIAGACAAVLAIGLGLSALLRAPDPPPAPVRLGQLTVSPPPLELELTRSEVERLLAAPPDLGPLSDPQHRMSCLSALGYPAGVRVLGGAPHPVRGRPGVLILLPADAPDSIVGLVLSPDCSSADPGLLADTVIGRP